MTAEPPEGPRPPGPRRAKAGLASLLPEVVHRTREFHREFLRLGLPPRRAVADALQRRKLFAYQASGAGLLPDGALSSVPAVVDLGANIGLWSRAIHTLARPDTLLAVEPQPEVLGRLRQIVGSRPGVTVVPVAVGAEETEMELHITRRSEGTSLRPPRADMHAVYGDSIDVIDRVPVPVRPLDDIARDLPEVTLLKIDVQGGEEGVLEGGRETLERTRFVLLEVLYTSHYEGDLTFCDLHERMVDAGFGLANVSPPFVVGDRALWADALYSRR